MIETFKVQKILLICIMIMLVLISVFFMFPKENINISETKLDSNDMFSIMLEQSDGTYKQTSDNNWPINKYEFDSTLSGCVDVEGNILENSVEYDSLKNKVKIRTTTATLCYLYFRKVPDAYAIYSADDTSLTFYKNKDLITVGDMYNGKKVTALYNGVEELNYYDSIPWEEYKTVITNVYVKDEIQPISTRKWFFDFENAESFKLEKLNTSKVTNMSYMFNRAGYNVKTLSITGITLWDTSNVLDMSSMYAKFGYNVNSLNLDLSNWNTESVTNMKYMFFQFGYNASTNLLSLPENTQNVTDMSNMFEYAGYKSTNCTFNNLANMKTTNVTDMRSMFHNACYNSTQIDIDLSKWDTSNVINMGSMFYYFGYKSTKFNLDLSNWNTSKVTNMSLLFASAGHDATEYNIEGISNWDTSNLENMKSMFYDFGYNSTSINLDLSKWDTKNITDMSWLFFSIATKATTFNLNLSNWNTENVTDMDHMFSSAGDNALTFNIIGIENWNTENVIDMNYMFYSMGNKADYILDLSKWKVTNVTSHAGFQNDTNPKIIEPVWVT